MESLLEKTRQHYFLILTIIFATILLSVNLNKPFTGHHDWNGVWYSNFARNFIKYGLWEARFGSILNYDIVPPESFKYATHYPPLLPIFLYLSFSTFGIHEWSARLVPATSTLATLVLIYLLGLKFFDKIRAVFAAAFASVLPITIYFGKIPVHEIMVIPAVLWSIYLYFSYFENQNRRNLMLLVVSLGLAHLIHWSGYFLIPIFSVHWALFSRNKKGKLFQVLLFPLISLSAFALHLVHLYWLTGSPVGGGLVNIFLDRLNITDQALNLTLLNFIKNRLLNLVAYFTRPLLLLVGIALIWLAQQIFTKSLNAKVQLLLVLAVFGIIYNLIFVNAAFIHDYTIYYLLPFSSIAASHGLFTVLEQIKSPVTKILFALLILALVSTERLKFTKALLSSSGSREGVRLGKIINENTQSGQRVLVLSPSFKDYYEVFTGFYADRFIEYKLPTSDLRGEITESDYSLVVAIPTRDTPRSLINDLQSTYQETRIDGFLIYDTAKTK